MKTVQQDYSGNRDTIKNCKNYLEYICSVAYQMHCFQGIGTLGLAISPGSLIHILYYYKESIFGILIAGL